MLHSLPLFHRIANQPVILVGSGEAAEAKRRLIERAGGVVVGEEAEAQLAFIALENPDAAAQRLRQRGILINVADRPDLCDFTLPSVLERGPVLIAVSTGGASAGLAKALRLRLEALLPASLGQLTETLGAARAKLRARWPDAADRRRALDAALGEGGALDPLDGDSAARFDGWISGAAVAGPWTAEFSLTSDDPDDLTLRQARWLGSADVIVFESGVSPAVLNRARADAARCEIEAGAAAPEFPCSVLIIRRG